MARPPLPIGQWGNIRCRKVEDGTFRAVTQFRDRDGKTRQVERYDTTDRKARDKLKRACEERAGDGVHALSRSSTFTDIAASWLRYMETRVRATSHKNYQRNLDNIVVPRIGGLRLAELTVPTLEEFFDELHEEGYSAGSRRSIRTAVRGPLSHAVRKGLISTNPVRDLSPVRGTKKKVRALNPDERVLLLAKLDELCQTRYFRGADLPDLVRFMLGTGVRLGEALAARWKDLNLGDSPAFDEDGDEIPPRSVSINGNIVFVTGGGLVRHDGKTENAQRTLALPEFLVTLLQVRRPLEARDDEPIFPSERLNWKHPNNVERSWRSARTRIKEQWSVDFTWVTPHVFRKTAATILDDRNLTARQVADQLGHANPSMTQNVYMARGGTNPLAAAALDEAYSRR